MELMPPNIPIRQHSIGFCQTTIFKAVTFTAVPPPKGGTTIHKTLKTRAILIVLHDHRGEILKANFLDIIPVQTSDMYLNAIHNK